jgi:hypothetical protein
MPLGRSKGLVAYRCAAACAKAATASSGRPGRSAATAALLASKRPAAGGAGGRSRRTDKARRAGSTARSRHAAIGNGIRPHLDHRPLLRHPAPLPPLRRTAVKAARVSAWAKKAKKSHSCRAIGRAATSCSAPSRHAAHGVSAVHCAVRRCVACWTARRDGGSVAVAVCVLEAAEASHRGTAGNDVFASGRNDGPRDTLAHDPKNEEGAGGRPSPVPPVSFLELGEEGGSAAGGKGIEPCTRAATTRRRWGCARWR